MSLGRNRLRMYIPTALLHDSQFDFRAGRSTEHAAALLTDHIRKEMDKGNYTGVLYVDLSKEMDKGNYTGVLYVDLSKAFDTISHSTITTKLKSFGILGTPKECFINYLFNRKLLVCCNGKIIFTSAVILWSSTRIHNWSFIIFTSL